MPYLIDIYTLAPERSAAAVDRFLDRFLPSRKSADTEYWVDLEGTNPAVILETPEEMLRYCEAHPEAEARAYWNSLVQDDPCSAHVFFLPGGALVFGLSVATTDRPAWDRWLNDLKSFAGAEHGYWVGECPPEDTIEQFVAVAKQQSKQD